MDKKIEHEKIRQAIKYWLLGRKYYKAERALEFANTYHKGYRKDKETPEFFHQVSMAMYARVFDEILSYSEETFSAIFLHDLLEDYDVSFNDILKRFGEKVAFSVLHLSRKYNGEKIGLEKYYEGIKHDEIASVVKGIDRINNIQDMVGVFTVKGQRWYVQETEEHIIPSLDYARVQFIEQERIYSALELNLKQQCAFIKELHKHI